MIRIENLHKRFGRLEVLRGVDLVVEDGKTTTVLGLSGSGKSTIIKHIVGLLKPNAGRVWVGEDEVTGMRPRELERVRLRFGMVFQNAALLQSISVFDNVALPLRERRTYKANEIHERVAHKLQLVQLKETDWEKLPAQLSGGMRKRVALARAIIEDPEYILWDEPTTGLDPITNNMVHGMIIDMSRQLGVTSMVISHDIPGTYRVSDTIAVLYRGKILETGTPDQIRNTKNPIVRQLIEGDTEGPITAGTSRESGESEDAEMATSVMVEAPESIKTTEVLIRPDLSSPPADTPAAGADDEETAEDTPAPPPATPAQEKAQGTKEDEPGTPAENEENKGTSTDEAQTGRPDETS